MAIEGLQPLPLANVIDLPARAQKRTEENVQKTHKDDFLNGVAA